jgi:hypothetical protein
VTMGASLASSMVVHFEVVRESARKTVVLLLCTIFDCSEF